MENVAKFWEENWDLLDLVEEDLGLNGRDYVLSIDNLEELKEFLKGYLVEKN
jgi:hypothetical protein